MAEMRPPPCSRCGRSMEEGLIIDRGHGNQRDVSKWLEGTPERGWFGWLKTRGRRQLPLITFRCTGCGYLESYAPALFSARARD